MSKPEAIVTLDYRIRRVLLMLLYLLLVAGVLGLLYYSRPAIAFGLNVLSPFIVALIVAYIFNPIAGFLQRRYNIRRLPAVIVVYFIILVVTLTFFAVVLPMLYFQLRDGVNHLVASLPSLVQKAGDWLGLTPEEIKRTQEAVRGRADWNAISEQAAPAVRYIMRGAGDAATFVTHLFAKGISFVLGFFAFIAFVIVITFYFLIDYGRIEHVVRVLLPDEREPRIFDIWAKVDHALGGFLRGQLIVCVIVGSLYTVALFLLGMRSYALLIGFLAGFGNLIPYFGPIAGGLPTALWVIFGSQYDTGHEKLIGLGLVILLSVAIQTMDGFFLQPRIVGKNAELHPLLVLLALLIGGQFGLGGLIIAVPLAIIVKTVLLELWWKPLEARELQKEEKQVPLAQRQVEQKKKKRKILRPPADGNAAPDNV